MILLDGLTTSQKILAELKTYIAKLPSAPRLDIILVGQDPASLKYVSQKQKKAKEVGINGEIISFPDSVNTPELLQKINELNHDLSVTVFMVQLPLPPHIDTPKVLAAIDPAKDADGLNPANLGKLFAHDPQAIAAATPVGIMKLLREYHLELDGQNVVIIGRSPIVGLPLAALMLRANATVTLCHSHTKNLSELCQKADIIVAALAKPKYVTADMVKDGAIVIDVGTNYDPSGKLCGDVDFESVAPKCSYITPVPGGVGPMTIAALLSNTYHLAIQKITPSVNN